MARKLFSRHRLPQHSLLLTDRLFGTPWSIWELREAMESTGSHLLMRVKANIQVVRERQLTDGSWLVNVKVVDLATRRPVGTLRLREIHANIHLEGSPKPKAIRLWTTLLDEAEHPALALVALYANRWEEELFFRELKSHLHGGGNLLEAQTPETAAQEVLAMLLAMQREAVAGRAEVEILRISFAKVLQKTAALCELLAVGWELIDPENLGRWIERILDDLATSALIQKRKPRSCPRTLRQPVKDWPKTQTPSSKNLTKTINVVNP